MRSYDLPEALTTRKANLFTQRWHVFEQTRTDRYWQGSGEHPVARMEFVLGCVGEWPGHILRFGLHTGRGRPQRWKAACAGSICGDAPVMIVRFKSILVSTPSVNTARQAKKHRCFNPRCTRLAHWHIEHTAQFCCRCCSQHWETADDGDIHHGAWCYHRVVQRLRTGRRDPSWRRSALEEPDSEEASPVDCSG